MKKRLQIKKNRPLVPSKIFLPHSTIFDPFVPSTPTSVTKIYDMLYEHEVEDLEDFFPLPEHKLLVHYLLRAWKDALGIDMILSEQDPTILTRKAIAWFCSNIHEPFSFLWVAEQLSLSHTQIKKILDSHFH